MKKLRNPKRDLSILKGAIVSTARTYGIAPHEVTVPQLAYVSGLGKDSFRYIGTFAAIREMLFPSPKRSQKVAQEISVIKRILENAKKQQKDAA